MNISNHIDRIAASAYKPVDGASAAVFRMIFGVLSFIAIIRFFMNDWIRTLYVEPSFHFKYLGFEWVQPWSELGLNIHFATLAVLALFIALGLFYRVSAALFFIGFLYIELLDAITYLNHYYWLSLTSALIIFMPLNRMWSLDAVVNPSIRADTVPQWVVWLIRAQLGIVYFFGGIAKLNPDWLLHALPMKIWMYQHGDRFLIGPVMQQEWFAYAMSWTAAVFDLTIIWCLLWKRTRPFAFLALMGFHLTSWQLFPALGMFPWLMMGSMLIYFGYDWPKRVGNFVRRRVGVQGRKLAPPLSPVSWYGAGPGHFPRERGKPGRARRREDFAKHSVWFRRAAVVVVALFIAFQVLFPLRHWAYPGNVRWNDEGYRFAWRMMLSEKIGFVTYRVVDNETGEYWLVEPAEYLTPLQIERMSVCPDMIHELALTIADDFRSRGYDDIAVYADAFVTFNGSPNTRIIDPNVDLASVSRSIFAKDWILPAPRARA